MPTTAMVRAAAHAILGSLGASTDVATDRPSSRLFTAVDPAKPYSTGCKRLFPRRECVAFR